MLPRVGSGCRAEHSRLVPGALAGRTLYRALLLAAIAGRLAAQSPSERGHFREGWSFTALAGLSRPSSTPPAIGRIELSPPSQGSFARVTESASESAALGSSAVWGFAVGRRRPLGARGTFALELSWTAHTRYELASDGTTSQTKSGATDASDSSVFAIAHVDGKLTFRSTAMLTTVVVEPYAIALSDRVHVAPFLAGGAGWSRTTVAPFRITADARLLMALPGLREDLRLSRETVELPRHSRDALAASLDAGVGIALGRHWILRSGYRRMRLGALEVIATTDRARYTTRLSSNGETLSILPMPRAAVISTHDVLVALQAHIR